MGTETNAGTGAGHTQKVASTKQPKCSICRQEIKTNCDWMQGRCPHRPNLINQIMSKPAKKRLQNLIDFFKKTPN